MEWYLKVLRQYADFNGRARRQEYWMFSLFNTIFAWVATFIDMFSNLNFGGIYEIGVLNSFYNLFVFIPSLAVAVRRLHDIDKSGWFMLLMFIPIIGWIWLLVLLCQDSTYGENQYGPNPKGLGNKDELADLGIR